MQRLASAKEILHKTFVWRTDADIVFWQTQKGIFLELWIPQKQTVNSDYYANTLENEYQTHTTFTKVPHIKFD